MKTSYCYGCMELLQPRQIICPRCGYDHSYRHNDDLFLSEGTILNGKYLIGKVLGKGGFGITYLGMDLTLRVKVAIKEYFPNSISSRSAGNSIVRVSSGREGWEGYQKGLMAFQAEAQTLAKFNSPSIVRVREYFQANNTAYIVMDFIDGTDLGEEIKQCGGRMAWQRVVNLFMPLMLELDKLHRKNLIHRDIKPENIKIVADEETGEERLVLLDFGAARGFTMGTVTYSLILTPGYAPYEQYQEKGHQGPFTDVYALCGTMYKAITGQKPPSAPDRMGNDDEKLQSFKSFGLDIPKAVEKAICHGLKKNAEDRPNTMLALHREFEKFEGITLKNPILTGNENTPPKPYNGDWNRDTIDEYVIAVTPDKQTKFISPLLFSFLIVAVAAVLLVPRFSGKIKTPQKMSDTDSIAAETGIPEVADIVETVLAQATDTPVPTNTPEPTPTLEPTSILEMEVEIVTLGHYEQDNDLSNGEETIEWQVLAKEPGRALLISRYALDTKPYNNKWVDGNWENSTLRQWLNSTFYDNSFNDEEKARIQTVTLSNPDNPKYGTKGGNPTTDRIFLLSIDEANLYFASDDDRVCQVTTYAKANGAHVDSGIDNSWWWLRSPGYAPYCSALINSLGFVDVRGSSVFSDIDVVRPAFWLNL